MGHSSGNMERILQGTIHAEVCKGLGSPARNAEAISISRCEGVRGESRISEPLESLATGEGCLIGAGGGGRGMQPLLE